MWHSMVWLGAKKLKEHRDGIFLWFVYYVNTGVLSYKQRRTKVEVKVAVLKINGMKIRGKNQEVPLYRSMYSERISYDLTFLSFNLKYSSGPINRSLCLSNKNWPNCWSYQKVMDSVRNIHPSTFHSNFER